MTKQDDNRCIEQVFSTTPGHFKPRRCNKPAGHGADSKYCTAHGRSTKDIEPAKAKRDRGDKLWR